MHDQVQRAKQYRQRAEELRTIAQDWIGQDTQRTLLKVAIDYERMAVSLERVANAPAATAGLICQ
jgi:hypothetical protein